VGVVKGLANFTVNASSASAYQIASVELNNSLQWVLVGSSVNFIP
jgi:hypothetical protein